MDLKNNGALRERLTGNGRFLVLNEYTWVRNAERVIEHMERARSAASGDIDERFEKDTTLFC